MEKLLGELYADRAPREETHSAVFDIILSRLQCARVSMWKFAGADDNLTLLCFASKSADGVYDTSDRRLHRDEFIDYFNRLVGTGTYVSIDAMNDPALEPLRESYLVPNNIVSMLDAAFVLNNRTYGMVCCEEPYRREWRPGDVVSLRAIVNKLALLMWNAPDSVLLKNPSLPLRVLLADSERPQRDPRRR
ncbi:MAG TPA: GAF domain-containing protein [Caldimonas sp.]|nr:GAF domain-containing protein [Caldimonas sp.]HEX4234411.1 GAF domain-containing protein [Caldimonas sp.]